MEISTQHRDALTKYIAHIEMTPLTIGEQCRVEITFKEEIDVNRPDWLTLKEALSQAGIKEIGDVSDYLTKKHADRTYHVTTHISQEHAPALQLLQALVEEPAMLPGVKVTEPSQTLVVAEQVGLSL